MATKFLPEDRMDKDTILNLSKRLRAEFLTPWMDAIPISIIVVNQFRQIIFCNEAFKKLSERIVPEEIMGLRPGEALNCVHACIEDGGCGCSEFCEECGAALAIVSSLRGNADCQECHMLRRHPNGESPLDLQVFTNPVVFDGYTFTLFTALDISHEKRLKYLERTFFHRLINEAGGIATLGNMITKGNSDADMAEMLEASAMEMLRDVVYHRDVTAAETGRLSVKPSIVHLGEFLRSVVDEMFRNNPSVRDNIDVAATGVEILTDPRLLRHTLRNLLINALEAREVARQKAGRADPVHLACTKEPEGVAITVTNDGTIPKRIRLQLFKRYVSSKGNDRGLGTYVIKLFTENYLQGSVSFVSKDEKTQFTLLLPEALQE